MKTLVVLFFFGRTGPTVCSSGRHHWPGVPSTDKRIREDLHKKVMGGDPVAARLPYAVLTEMVTFSGWERFEMNETLKFHGVTEMTLPSIMRRSLNINCKGRFVGAQRFASLLPGTLVQEGERFRDLTACGGCLVRGELCDVSVATFRAKD